MTKNQFDRPARKSPRLKGYDYAQDGMYFLTICTQQRMSLFGAVENGIMILNPAGQMVQDWWQSLPEKYSDVELDLFVVMPNHFHGIIAFMPRADTSVRPYDVPQVMQWFKTMTTNHYMQGVRQQNWQPFPSKLWQRSFHDRIIRSAAERSTLRQYILANPARWQEDRFFLPG